ncbi:MAG: carbohydrate ABC transporter permease [Aristaeellaceae bacterium]
MAMVKHPHERRHLTKRTLREWIFGYIFISPWLVGVSIFFLYAMVRSLIFSFNDLQLVGMVITPLKDGLFSNYSKVFATEINLPVVLAEFAISLVLQLPIIISFALIIALLLNSKIKGRSIFRLIFFLPVIIATGPVMDMLTAQGVASVPMVGTDAIASVLSSLPEFVAEPISELFSSLILILWNAGIQILLFLAGLQKVTTTMYEAAKIDGANAWETFWKITLPNVRSIILLCSIYTVVTLATGGNNAVIQMIYDATYSATKGYSYGAAFSWIYTVVIIVILLLVFLLLREKSDKKIKYEESRSAREERLRQQAAAKAAKGERGMAK